MVTETVSPLIIASWVCCAVRSANTPNADNYRQALMQSYPTSVNPNRAKKFPYLRKRNYGSNKKRSRLLACSTWAELRLKGK